MKSTGFIRKVDSLGRMVLPVGLRKTFEIDIKDPMEVYVDREQIILKKYEPDCVFCGNARDVANYKGKNICNDCMKELKNSK